MSDSPEKNLTKNIIDKKTLISGATLFVLGLGFWFIPPMLFSSDKENIENPASVDSSSSPSSSPTPQVLNTPEKKQKIAIESYIDFTCMACRDFYKDTFRSLTKDYKDDIELTFLYYPHYNTGLSMEVAKFSLCASEQKNTSEILDFFFTTKETIETIEKEVWINELVLNSEQMEKCLQTAEEKILEQKLQAQAKGVRGTPTTFIGEKKIEENVPMHILEIEIVKQQNQ